VVDKYYKVNQIMVIT